jgi:hypothetical protein
LRRDAIPEAGRPFLGLAQRLGVFDEDFGCEAIDRLSESDRSALLFFRMNLPVEVDQWLCGDEAMARPPSPEYTAFAALYLVADYLYRQRMPSTPQPDEAADRKGCQLPPFLSRLYPLRFIAR